MSPSKALILNSAKVLFSKQYASSSSLSYPIASTAHSFRSISQSGSRYEKNGPEFKDIKEKRHDNPNDSCIFESKESKFTSNNPSSNKKDLGAEQFFQKLETTPPADSTFPPEAQDFMMEKIDPEYLKEMCNSLWHTAEPEAPLYAYLETAEVFPKKLPLRGAVLGLNRLWVNLVCQTELKIADAEKPEFGIARNVTFIVEPSSPYSYLSRHALDSLIHNKRPLEKCTNVAIHPIKILGVEEFNVSPASSHFSGANILGSNFFKRNKLALFVNYRRDEFKILETSVEEGLY